MSIIVSEFDITTFDSGKIDLSAPEWIAHRLKDCLGLTYNREVVPGVKEEIRLRLFSNAIMAANLVKYDHVPDWVENFDSIVLDTSSIKTQVVQTRMGLNLMRIGHWLIVMLPELKSQAHSEEIVNFLNGLQDQDTGATHWVFDLSAVTQHTSTLMAYLIGFKHGLARFNQHLLLLWVRRDAVPATLQPSIKKHFQLIKKGSFFVSKLC